MTDPALTDCENCGGLVKKVLYPVGIAFKGSGFYVNDYAKPAPAAAASAAKDEGAPPTQTPEAKPATETKTEPSTTPAAPAATEASAAKS